MFRFRTSSLVAALCVVLLSFSCAEEPKQTDSEPAAAEAQLNAAHIVYYAIPG